MLKWIKDRKKRNAEELRSQGYSYAAAKLLKSQGEAVKDLMNESDRGWPDRNEFDQGIDAAICDFYHLKWKFELLGEQGI